MTPARATTAPGAALLGLAPIEGHGMRGGPAGRRWSWRPAVPAALPSEPL